MRNGLTCNRINKYKKKSTIRTKLGYSSSRSLVLDIPCKHLQFGGSMLNLLIPVIPSGFNYINLQINIRVRSSIDLDIHKTRVSSSELKSLEWDILNPDLLIHLEINNKRRTINI